MSQNNLGQKSPSLLQSELSDGHTIRWGDFMDRDAMADAYLVEAISSRRRFELLQHDSGWSNTRRRCAKVVRKRAFEISVLFIITCNMITTIVETDARAAGDSSRQSTYKWTNRVFLFCYILELAMRLYVHRWKYFESKMNLFDLAIILGVMIIEVLSNSVGSVPAASMLRIIRIARFLRAGHIIVFFPELYWMTRGMFCALKSLFWGILLIIVVLTMWSIVAVEVLDPLMDGIASSQPGIWDDCNRCSSSFESVSESLLTLFSQIVAGDSWAYVSAPLIRAHPWQAIPILGGALFSVNLGILNLILAVIVDRAQQAHAEDLRHIIKVKTADYKSSQQKLFNICKSMDSDDDGSVSVSELASGYEENPDFRAVLQAMDITKEDMDIVFSIMDTDKSGTIDYEEFAQQLHKMKSSDSHTLLIFIQHYVKDVREKVSAQVKLLQSVIEKKVDERHKEIIELLEPGTPTRMGKVNSCPPIVENQAIDANFQPPAPPSVSSNADIDQLRQAMTELTAVIRDSARKKTGVGLDTLEAKDTNCKTPTSNVPVSENAFFTCSSVERRSSVAQEREGNIPLHRCCQVRMSNDGLAIPKVVQNN